MSDWGNGIVRQVPNRKRQNTRQKWRGLDNFEFGTALGMLIPNEER